MLDTTAYFNGEWVPFSEVKISPLDRGFDMGDVVFDVARTFGGKPFMLKEHVDRLYRSLKHFRIDPDLSHDEMMEISLEVLRRNDPLREEAGDFAITQFVTRGPTPFGHGFVQTAGPPTVCVNARPIAFGAFAHYYDEGAHGVITKTRTYPTQVLDPKVKSFSRGNFVLAELDTADVDPGAYPILLDEYGNVAEGITNNIFLVKDGVIRTPTERSILQGVTRQAVMEIAEQLELPLVEEDLQPYHLLTADEVFFSRTSPVIVPVSQVNLQPIGDEVPGQITKQLIAAFSEKVGVDIEGQAKGFARA